MRNIVKLFLTTFLITTSSVAAALDDKSDTQFSIYEIVKSYYSFDICIPKKDGITPSITIVYWDGIKNVLSVHPESREYNQTWLHSNVLYQAHDKTRKISVSVDFNLDNGERVKTESYTLSTVTSDFKTRGLIVSAGKEYEGCSIPDSSTYGEVHSFTSE
ncbi:hypothetical protein A9Q79_05980 [Methylophaga sp. 42_25_T18]|nr:hypothetical protein A9Q79_05980 [Methylophaga sp. 42_25_T18]